MTLPAIANGVILAENDALMRGVIRSVLLRAEQQVFPAADGVEAVVLARQFRARLVLLDIGMPRLNGLLACQAIHALPGYANVPIVMLTGYDDSRLREAAKRLGASDFVTKPFQPDLLLARLAAYLDMPAQALPKTGTAVAWGTPGLGAAGDDVRGTPVRRAQVWRTPQDPNSAYSDPQLVEGREVMRIFRSAERKP